MTDVTFEYRIDKKSYDAKADVVSDLNALGAQGWELIWLEIKNEERGRVSGDPPGTPDTPVAPYSRTQKEVDVMSAKTKFSKVVAEYAAAPGELLVESVPDGLVHCWRGGRIATCADDTATLKVVARAPWHIEYLCRDARLGMWYVRRGALKNPWYEG